MEKKPPLVMTPFDESVTNDFLQFIKIILPYFPFEFRRIAGIFVKMTEFLNAFYCFQPPYYHHNRRGRLRSQETDPEKILDEISPYLSSDKREMLDSFLQAWQMMQMVKNMDLNSFENMADFMSTQDMETIMNEFSSERKKNNERMDGKPEPEESGSCQAGADPDSRPANPQ